LAQHPARVALNSCAEAGLHEQGQDSPQRKSPVIRDCGAQFRQLGILYCEELALIYYNVLRSRDAVKGNNERCSVADNGGRNAATVGLTFWKVDNHVNYKFGVLSRKKCQAGCHKALAR